VRIVSLLPSLTEICYLLGLDEQVVAVTHECDYPPAARGKPWITRSVLPDGITDSAEIDRLVKEKAAAGEPLYELDTGLLARLKPDLILTQELCHVCAVSYDDVLAIARRLAPRPKVVSIEPKTLDEVLNSILQVGELTGRSATAKAAVNALRQRLDRLGEQVAQSESRPRAACLEWLDPPMVGGHWVPEMVDRAGGVDPLGRAGQPSFEVEWQTVIDGRPEAIVLMPCGYDLWQTVAETERLLAAGRSFPPELRQTPAVRNGQVYAVDGSGYFSRPGPRLFVGIDIIAGILHAELMTEDIPARSVQPLRLEFERPDA
jgi:iron complex transport system substrate-binding protein